MALPKVKTSPKTPIKVGKVKDPNPAKAYNTPNLVPVFFLDRLEVEATIRGIVPPKNKPERKKIMAAPTLLLTKNSAEVAMAVDKVKNLI